jgi:phosphohistidine phosphatase SixA
MTVPLLVASLSCLVLAQTPATAAIASLRAGGFVIVMRHASSPADLPTGDTASRDNTTLERQLDRAGREGATAFGDALRRLQIPVGDVFVSPTYRTRETARLARLPDPTVVAEIGESTGSMQAVSAAQLAWLQKKVTEVPRAGTNTVIITHSPNMLGAFPNDAAGIAQGEAIVFRPSAAGATVVGRIKIDDWP